MVRRSLAPIMDAEHEKTQANANVDEDSPYNPSDIIAAEKAKDKKGSRSYLARYYPSQSLAFGSFERIQFGSFSDDVDSRQNSVGTRSVDSAPSGNHQAQRTEDRANRRAVKKRKQKEARTAVTRIQTDLPAVTATSDLEHVSPSTSKKTKLSALRAAKRKLEGDIVQLTETNAALVEQQSSREEEVRGIRTQLNERENRLRRADAEIIRLSGEISHLRGIVEGMRTHAEIQGEPSNPSRQNDISTSKRLRAQTSNASAYSSSNGSDVSRPRKSKKTSHTFVKKPVPKQWGGSKDEENVGIFVDRLHRYFTSHNVAIHDMPYQALDFLDGKAFQLWKLESEMLGAEGQSLTWGKFESFMKQSFGSLDPERHARQQFDALKQTGTVFQYVTEFKRLIRIMHPMPMIRPGPGDIVSRFISGARPELREYLTANTPEGYWKTTEQLFEKATTWALNTKAIHKHTVPNSSVPTMATMQGKKRHSFNRGRAFAARGGRPAESGSQPAKKAKVEAPKWSGEQKRRLMSGHCPYCNGQDHVYTACLNKPESSKRF